jgi:hypothetical protein
MIATPASPFWRANVDVDSLFAAHANRPDRVPKRFKEGEWKLGRIERLLGEGGYGLLDLDGVHALLCPPEKSGVRPSV